MISRFFAHHFDADGFTDSKGKTWKKLPTEWLPVGSDYEKLTIYIAETPNINEAGFYVRYYFSGTWGLISPHQDHRGKYAESYEFTVSDLLAAIVRRFPADTPVQKA